MKGGGGEGGSFKSFFFKYCDRKKEGEGKKAERGKGEKNAPIALRPSYQYAGYMARKEGKKGEEPSGGLFAKKKKGA